MLESGHYQLIAKGANNMGIWTHCSPCMEFEIKGDETTRVTFHLVESADFKIRLLDERGNPVVGAQVGNDGFQFQRPQSDASGVVSFGRQAPGQHSVSILSGGVFVGESNVETITVARGGVTTDVRTIPAPVQIRVTGVGSARVELQSLSRMLPTPPTIEPDGSVTFRGVPTGPMFVRVFHRGESEYPAGARADLATYADRREFEFRDGRVHEVKR
jgi:hypothetical protein